MTLIILMLLKKGNLVLKVDRLMVPNGTKKWPKTHNYDGDIALQNIFPFSLAHPVDVETIEGPHGSVADVPSYFKIL